MLQKKANQGQMGGAGLSAFFLVGPTAAGKSTVAHCIALSQGYAVISADSMLVYSGMDIGTAKPTVPERAEVEYHGLDLATPGDCFSAGQFRTYALDVLSQITDSGRQAVVVGGTGLYVKSLTDGLDMLSGSDPDRVAFWSKVFQRNGMEALQDALRQMSPSALDAVGDKMNHRRIIRALVLTESGMELPDRSWGAGRRPGGHVTGLAMSPEVLGRRIVQRVDRMYDDGLLDEVRQLRERFADFSSTAGHAIGYREACACLDGKLTIDEARERTVIRTRQLAKRQRTWFRHQACVSWVEIDDGMRADEVAGMVLADWRDNGATDIAC